MDLITALTAAGGASAGGGASDPNFNQTVLLLHGDGTNGAQNNTFLDSSTNNFTITRNGNTTQGTFSPFSQTGWSNYFDGSGDYLSIASNADFAYGTGDFTWEAWVYRTTTTNDSLYTTMVADGFIVHIISGNVIVRQFGVADLITSSATVSANTWTHIAVARSGTTLSLWLNGSRSSGGTTTNSTNFTQNGVRIGINDIDTNLLVGYLSNLRSVKGTAIYDPTSTTITVPTAPVTAVSGTELLTCQSNRFKDNSSNAFAITVNGNPSIQPFSPFAPSAAYSASVNGGSGYFDSTGDYLSVPSDTDFAFNAEWTIECWVYASAIDLTSVFFVGGTNGAQFSTNASGNLAIAQAGVGFELSSSAPLPLNQWNHIAAARDNSNNTSIFLNGTRVATGTITTSYPSSGTAYINYNPASTGSNFTGYLFGLRVVKGRAVYDPTSTTLSVPTAPLTATSGGDDPPHGTETSLLLSGTNAGIFDNTGKNNLETVGNVQLDTATKVFGTGSLEFDGSGDYLLVPNNGQFVLGDTATIEFWAYQRTRGPNERILYTLNQLTGIDVFVDSSGILKTHGGLINTSYTVPANTWIYVSLVYNAGSLTIYVNGTSQGTGSGVNITNTNALTIGSLAAGSYWDGYIDDLRITKGVARDGTVVPTAPFPDQ